MAEAVRKIRLHFGLSQEAISAMASETLQAGGQPEVPPAPAARQTLAPKLGDNTRRVNERAVHAGDPIEQIGAVMEDGTVYAGLSPDTRKPMYAASADASLTMTFNKAKKYATRLRAHGHKDWRVPTQGELNVLFKNRAAIGGFDMSGSHAGRYWSSSQNDKWFAWCQHFSDGQYNYCPKDFHAYVRCVG